MNKGRRGLYFLAAAGLLSLGVGGGTFATFNAQTTNPGNTFSTGSITLTDTATTPGTTCFSYGTGSSNNANSSACGAIVNVSASNASTIATGLVTLTNGGTLPASNFTLTPTTCTNAYANSASVTFSGTSTTGTGTNLTAVAANGDTVVGSSGVNSINATVTAVTATSITISGSNPASGTYNLSFSLGALNTSTTLCSSAGFYVEEVAQETSGTGVANPVVQCVSGANTCPTYATLTGAVNTGTKTITLSGTGLTVSSGDTIEVINQTGVAQTFTSSTSGTNQTSITYTTSSGSATTEAGDAVVDLSAVPASAPLTLSGTPAFTSATLSTPATLSGPLPSNDTRIFEVGVYVPGGASSNSLQDLSESFGLNWQITA